MGPRMRRKAWCPACDLVDHVDARWRCLWCGTVTLKRTAQPRESRGVWASLLIEAHTAHAQGATMREAAELIQDRAGYTDNRLLRGQLPEWWAGLGLPCRSHGDAQRLRYIREPRRHERPDVTPETAIRALRLHGTRAAAAASLRVSRKTLRKRLARVGSLA